MAAENPDPAPASVTGRASFNEAAANGRGKLSDEGRDREEVESFNEAAANGRGKPTRAGRHNPPDSLLQ